MKTTAIPLSPLRLASRSNVAARLPHFITLMKPRVMVLAVFTALVGLMIAPVRLDPLPGLIAILAIAAGAGAAGVLNMWYDADIDGVMARTAGRFVTPGSVGIWPHPCRQRRRGSCCRAQSQDRGAARLCDLLLRRRLHDV